MIYKQLDKYDFINEFKKMGRDYYSYEAYEHLFGYYDDISDMFEIDVIGICGEWDEFKSLEELKEYFEDAADYIELSNGNYLVQSY